MRKFGGCLTLGLALMCVPMAFAAVWDAFTGNDNVGLMIGMGVMFGGFALGFGWASTKLFRAKPEMSSALLAAQERTILHLAANNGGTLTVPQLTAGSQLSLVQAEQALDHMHSRRVAELEVTEEGAEVYRFIGLLPPAR